jgi:integrase/recombinase XerD
MTFKQYLSKYHTSQTVDIYLWSVDHFLTHCPTREKSSYSDILNYLALSRKNVNVNLSAIKKYFDYQIEIEQRDSHPCKNLTIKLPSKPIQFQDLFSADELEKLLDRRSRYKILKNRNKAIISLLIYQGLSPANIVNLRLKDVNLDQGTLYIRSTPKLSRRTLELKSSQSLLFYRYINNDRNELDPNNDRLFVGKLAKKITPDTINRMLLPLKKYYKHRNLNARTIRQSVISNWINGQKVTIEDVQLLAGHKWLSTTEKYKKARQR